nr:MAG TPA: hypothetical protein [Caudoviricetes sp.]
MFIFNFSFISLILFCNIKEGSVHIRYTPSDSGFVSLKDQHII